MLRSIRGFIFLVSLLMCAGASVLWVRSRNHVDLLLVRTAANQADAAAGLRSGLLLAQSDLAYDGYVSADGDAHALALLAPSSAEFEPMRAAILDDPPAVKFSLLGFKATAGTAAISTTLAPHYAAMLVPYWLIVTMTAVIPLWSSRVLWIRWRRIRKGMCLGCGYDIRASVGRCPECGRAIPGRRVGVVAIVPPTGTTTPA